MTHSPMVPVPARRHPYQVFLAGLLMLSGAQVLAGGPKPTSVSAALPGPLLYVWAGVLVGSGAMVVAAAIVRPLAALYLELMAHPPLAISCWVYGASAVSFAGWRATLPAAIVAGLGGAGAWRAVQVLKTFKAIRKALEDR